MLNTIIIDDMIHFLNIFTQKWRPRHAGLSNSNGNPIGKRWDAELPKIANVRLEKEVFRGI